MIVKYIDKNTDVEKLQAEMKAQGYHVAAISNTGCEPGTARVTFLPSSAFKKGSENNP